MDVCRAGLCCAGYDGAVWQRHRAGRADTASGPDRWPNNRTADNRTAWRRTGACRDRAIGRQGQGGAGDANRDGCANRGGSASGDSRAIGPIGASIVDTDCRTGRRTDGSAGNIADGSTNNSACGTADDDRNACATCCLASLTSHARDHDGHAIASDAACRSVGGRRAGRRARHGAFGTVGRNRQHGDA